jgi:ATP-dependent helicase HrpB
MLQLPIDAYLDQIIEKSFSDLPLILLATPGSGKTTRVPAKLLKELRLKSNTKKIVVIVPKRIAAVSACDRIADENNWRLGSDVGYQVRFESVCEKSTQLIFMTEGIFLKKVQNTNFWNDIGYIILDEFHERSASIDLILGLSFERKILNNTGSLQIIVMSATLNVDQLKYFFTEFQFVQIQQPPHKLDTVYQKTSQSLYCDSTFYQNLKAAAVTAVKISKKDILVFLPGFREIIKSQAVLKAQFPDLQIEYVYGGMSLPDQKRVLNKVKNERRIILATNIAESSLTVPELDCVIDSGLEKTVVSEKKMGFTKLETVRISQFSATQRAGRAARTGPGTCFKLWHEIDDRSLPEQKKPEILQSDLLEEVLVLAELGITDFQNFSWLDQPAVQKLNSATEKLRTWNLIDSANKVSAMGKQVAQIPLDIRAAILFYELCRYEFTDEACHLFSVLETIDVTKRSKHNPYDLNSDLDYIFQAPETLQQKKIHQQLKKVSEFFQFYSVTELKINFESCLLEIHARYFPERICLKKSPLTGLSASGRGVEFLESSAIQSDKIPNDYIVVLSAFEKSGAATQIQLGAGYAKTVAQTILKKYLSQNIKIEFKPEQKKFMKKTVQNFGEFVFNESSPETFSESELNDSWAQFVKDSPELFLKMNPHFEKIVHKINFLKLKSDALHLQTLDFDFFINFVPNLAVKLTENINHFSDFLSADIIYFLPGLMPEAIYQLLLKLPDEFVLPTGRSVFINYTDPKAPMISAKIQDCFQWQNTPKLLNQIPLTIELLAPNRRPAQITNDLNQFWKNSYKDVRKDLRARYPKHHWPEDVLNAQPSFKPK